MDTLKNSAYKARM